MAKDPKRKQLQLYKGKSLNVNEDIDLSSSGGECRNLTFGAKCENATHTPKSGKMESSGTPKNSEDDLRGQISSPWCVLYINGKVLKLRFPKWPRMGHLDI